jgi:hypothetical protein
MGNVHHPADIDLIMHALAILLVGLDIALLFFLLDAERAEREEIERRSRRSHDGEPTS